MPTARTKWPRFRLRTLFLLTTACSLLLGVWSIYVSPYRAQARSLAVVRSLNGHYSVMPAEGSNWQRNLVTALLGNEAFVYVTNVNLANRNVDDQKLRSLAGLAHLEELTLDYNPIGENAVGVFTSMPKLERLSLRYTKITDKAARLLCQLPSLRRLSLTGTPISDDAAKQLATHDGFTELNLRWTSISDQAAERLATALPNCAVHHHALAAPP